MWFDEPLKVAAVEQVRFGVDRDVVAATSGTFRYVAYKTPNLFEVPVQTLVAAIRAARTAST